MNLNNTITKLKLSIDEIVQKNPQRVDLTDSMRKTIEDINFSILTFSTLEKEYRSSRELNNSLTYQNLVMYQELKEIKEKIKESEVNLTYLDSLERENIKLKKDLDLFIDKI